MTSPGSPGRGGRCRYETDVLVVGAGPAGAVAAREAARAGARVLLVERKREVGVPVRCAEFVPWGVADLVSPSRLPVVQRVEGLRTHVPSGRCVRTRSPGVLLDRAFFDRRLTEAAAAAGAEVWTRARLVRRLRGGFRVEREGRSVVVEAQVLIGADGPRSLVAEWLGNPPQRCAVGAQVTVTLTRPQAEAEVFFGPEYPGGYGWLFPRGGSANVGVAVDRALGGEVQRALAGLLGRLGRSGLVAPGAILRRTGGLIPIGGPRQWTQTGRVLLVGDAAGHTHPITGAGIHHALVGGGVAGRLAAEAVASGEPAVLDRYEKECRAWLGGALQRAVDRRALYEARWRSGERGDDLYRRTWVAFKEYYCDAA
ncbi:MAG: NAD(P)/FAD-dependent oxidoreductase [Deltaproteobacteria bacterium]|nr:NAD(P)/FAD-dependent oxidoreductase [Deltaproteobacteria bacterium]